MKKGKRNLVFEFDGRQVNSKEIESNTYKKLKEKGICYSDDISMYANLNDEKIYCVVNGETVVVEM